MDTKPLWATSEATPGICRPSHLDTLTARLHKHMEDVCRSEWGVKKLPRKRSLQSGDHSCSEYVRRHRECKTRRGEGRRRWMEPCEKWKSCHVKHWTVRPDKSLCTHTHTCTISCKEMWFKLCVIQAASSAVGVREKIGLICCKTDWCSNAGPIRHTCTLLPSTAQQRQ